MSGKSVANLIAVIGAVFFFPGFILFITNAQTNSSANAVSILAGIGAMVLGFCLFFVAMIVRLINSGKH